MNEKEKGKLTMSLKLERLSIESMAEAAREGVISGCLYHLSLVEQAELERLGSDVFERNRVLWNRRQTGASPFSANMDEET